jgi:peroxiredoxin Q/BCP
MEEAIRRTMGIVVAVLVLFIIGLIIEEKSGLLHEGDKAPEFEVRLSEGKTFRLKDLEGKKNVVLFFYPKDFTTGCTAQACSIRDGYSELSRLDAVVLGVSGDGSKSHDRFRTQHNLPFDLIADTDRVLINAFGVERLDGWLKIPKRVSYVIDKSGVIRLVAHHEFRMGKHLDDVLQTLRRLAGTGS